MAPTRRDVLRVGAAGGLALATRALVGCGDNEPASPYAAAVAILDPDAAAFTVAVWTNNHDVANVEVWNAAALVARGTVPSGAAGLDVTGLAPDTRYTIRVATAAGASVGPLSARTAPADSDARPVRIAVGADFDPAAEFDTDLVDALVAAQPELYVSIGDTPYTDNGPVSHTLDEYRDCYAQLRLSPRAQQLHAALGVRAIYDDHELINDCDAMRAAAQPARYAAALQAWDEFFPVRGAVGDVRYRRWRWGAHLECFLLDCRRYRSANDAADGPGKTMLGDAQRAWLVGGVHASTATWKLIFTSVPLDYGTGDDHWASFAYERAQLFDALVGVPGVVFASGDQHWFAAHRHAHGVREFQIGPLARGLGEPPPPVDGVLFRAVRTNVGLVDVDGDQLTFTGLGEHGERFYSETLTAADATPR